MIGKSGLLCPLWVKMAFPFGHGWPYACEARGCARACATIA